MATREERATLKRVLAEHPPVLDEATRVLGNYERRLAGILRAVREGKLEKAGGRITPEDLAELSRLVEREHEQVGRLLADGVERSYVYGRLLSMASTEAERAAVRAMSVTELVDAVQKVRLTADERASVDWARHHAGELCRGLGNVVTADMRTVAIEADKALRGQYVADIAEGVEAGLTKRDAWRKIASALGHKTGDWARDMRRVAATEKQAAVEEGVADGIQKRAGAEARVAKVPEPGACADCRRLFLDGGKPRIFSLAELRANGTNVGVKRANWKPVLGTVHPWCLPPGQLVRTRRGNVRVEDVEVGDHAMTHLGRYRRVRATSRRWHQGLIVVIRLSELPRDRLELTLEHEVRTRRRWLPAAEVGLNDALLRPAVSAFDPVEHVSRYRYEGFVHNLAVDEDESYAAQGVAVHNCACGVTEVPEGFEVAEDGTLERLERSQTLWRDLTKAIVGPPPPTLTYGDSVPQEGVVVRVGDPEMRSAVDRVVADTPPGVFHRDVAVTLITTDTPRPGNPLEEHDLAYWTGNEIRIMQTLPVARVDYCLRHEIGHSMNVWLIRKLGSVPAVREWHDGLWAVSKDEGWVSEYAKREPIENAAEVLRMYLYERQRLMLRFPRQFSFVHKAYREVWRRPLPD
jgi:hypothetical protein